MKLTFRQGIARYQTDVYATPAFLQRTGQSGEFIDLIVSPDPTIIIFAHRAASYVVEESRTVTHAWGPFNSNTTQYLYWDINLLDASLTRGFTAFPPIVSAVEPPNPAIDQHWYDASISQMKVWNGFKWVDKVRVFAGTYSSQAIIQPLPIGTQVGETGTFEAGNLVLDSFNKPLRQSDGTFVTSSTELSIINAATQKVKFESEIVSGMAEESIAKYSLVQVRPNRRIALARSDDWRSRIRGIVTEDLYQSEVGAVITDGLVRNEQWHWTPANVGRPVFCGPTGQVSISPPSIGVNQIAGYVYDTDAIYLQPGMVTILDQSFGGIVNPPVAPPLAPVADFYASPLSGVAPLTVHFTSTSIHAPISFEWDFKNDGTIDASTPEADYTFNLPGVYAVRLRAINNYGQDEEVKNALITVEAASTFGLETNLGVSLEGPAQVNKNSQFTIIIKLTNDGHLKATAVRRVISIDDLAGSPIMVGNLPSTATLVHGPGRNVITLPVIPELLSGQFANLSFILTAPDAIGDIVIRASVSSPETDSTPSDNLAELIVKVK